MNKCSVTVLVLTYNPDENKLISTLKSVICQKNIDFEIVITDDGSNTNFWNKVLLFFEKNNFTNYKEVHSNKNTGTIKNILRGLDVSSGKYIYTISAGDCLFDENVLSNLFNFTNSNGIDICFGKAIYYSNEGEKIKLYDITHPVNDDVYKIDNYNIKNAFISFLGSNYICGASYFRSKQVFQKYLLIIEKEVIFAEDMATTMVSFAEGNPVVLYDGFVCWYEYGSGISTKTNHRGSNRLDKDKKNLLTLLKTLYPNDKLIDSRVGSRATRFIKHPIISVLYKLERFKKKNTIDIKSIDSDYLSDLLMKEY